MDKRIEAVDATASRDVGDGEQQVVTELALSNLCLVGGGIGDTVL
jgi:hypothetical protein